MNMTELQKRIDDLGIRDIKLFRTGPVSEAEVVELLTMHLDGHSVKLGLIGDTNMDNI